MKYTTSIATALYVLAQVQLSSAFSPTDHVTSSAVRAGVSVVASEQHLQISKRGARNCNIALNMSSEDEGSNSSARSTVNEENVSAEIETQVTAQTEKATEPPKAEVPLDLPSPILLASSMVLAIASTGSIFELLGGSPQYGFAPTVAIALLGTPLCFFLFYAAIVKGNAETEADDQRFMDNNKSSSSGFF